MSRGHGLLQQRIISYLEEYEHQTAEHIAWALERLHFTQISMPSLRRALRGLEAEGVVLNEGTSRNDVWQLSAELLILAATRRFHAKADQKSKASRDRRERKKRRDQSEHGNTYDDFFEQQRKRIAEKQDGLVRVAKLLEMLGSEHDGEVMSAARKLHEFRVRSNKSWSEIFWGSYPRPHD
jgi:hypothetical protein